MLVVFIAVFIMLLFTGMPIAFALAITTLGGFIATGYDPIIFFHRMLNSLNSFTLLAVPLYVLAGNLCSQTGITERLVRLCTAFVGHIPGGSGLVNVLASIFFGGISGSAVADTSAIGGMLIPVMKEEGYDAEFAGGITIASSTIGILVPPSIPQCLYGISAGISIGALFMAGVIPGLLVGLFQMIICYLISQKRHYPCHPKANWRVRGCAVKDALWALGLPLIILIGCGIGIVSASEAGILAVLYAVFIGACVYKELDIRCLPNILVDSMVTSAVALYIVGVASVVSWVINAEGIPQLVVYFLSDTLYNGVLVLLAINLVLFICGCFMDLVPIILLFAPIFLPIVQNYGISAWQFGVIMTINLGIGLLTPPVGNCLFIGAGISGISTIKLFRGALPFVACNILCLIMVHVFPALTDWLPTILGY